MLNSRVDSFAEARHMKQDWGALDGDVASNYILL